MKDERLYLIHILECISRIEQYAAAGKDAFLRETMRQDAVLRNLQTLAESTQHLSAPLKMINRDVPWERIAGFRNVLVHEYLGINIARVWEIIEQALPELKLQVEAILRGLGEAS